MRAFPLPESDPAPLLRLRETSLAQDLIIAAVGWLDLFDWLEENPTDLEGICSGLGIRRRPADVLMTLCRAYGLIERRGGVFRITPTAEEFLTRGSPFDLRPYLASLRNKPACLMLLRVLRSDLPAAWEGGQGGDEWAKAMLREDFAGPFTSAMDSRGMILAPLLAEALDCTDSVMVLDIAGGSGIYSCALAARYPGLRAVVLERPPVDRMALETITLMGFGDRVEVMEGDMFDGLPPGFDLHLFSHVLHDWGEEGVSGLLSLSFEALEPGGRVAVFDAHLNEEKSGPLEAAEYSVLLMSMTEGKCYSVGELRDMLYGAGFTGMEVAWTAHWRSLVTAVKPG